MPMASASDGLEFTIPGLPHEKNRLSHGREEHKAGIIMSAMMHRRASDSYFGH
jgi:hypothetical protein